MFSRTGTPTLNCRLAEMSLLNKQNGVFLMSSLLDILVDCMYYIPHMFQHVPIYYRMEKRNTAEKTQCFQGGGFKHVLFSPLHWVDDPI